MYAKNCASTIGLIVAVCRTHVIHVPSVRALAHHESLVIQLLEHPASERKVRFEFCWGLVT